jgi:hypothetical protein
VVKEGKLTFRFHDREDEYERSPLPFGCGEESLWEATRIEGGTWTLRRLRSLDYDGADQYLKWEDVKELE